MGKELENFYEEEVTRCMKAIKNHIERFDKTDDNLERQVETHYVIREAKHIYALLKRIRGIQKSLEEEDL